MSDTFIINPRATLGDNQPDPAQAVADRLARDYVDTFLETDRLGDEAGQMPELVTSDDTALGLGAMIKRMKDHDATLESFREAEKLPFLRGGNAVDNTFFVQRDKLARRRKGDRSVKPGCANCKRRRRKPNEPWPAPDPRRRKPSAPQKPRKLPASRHRLRPKLTWLVSRLKKPVARPWSWMPTSSALAARTMACC